MQKGITNLILKEDAAALAEYALLLGLIALTMVTVLNQLSSRLSAIISKAAGSLPS